MTQGIPKPFVPAKLCNRKGDLSKRWYVEFSAYDEKTRVVRRKQIFCPAKYETQKQRELWAKNEIDFINGLLEQGKYFRDAKAVKPKPRGEITKIFPAMLEARKNSLRPKSYRTYKTTWKKLEAFLKEKHLEKLEVPEFGNALLSDFIDYLLRIGNSNRTVNNSLEQMGWFFEQSVAKELIDKKPYKRNKLPETDSNSNVAFTPQHQRILEEYLLKNDYPLYLFTRFIYHAFIRPRELREIQVIHLDFTQRRIFVKGMISKSRKNESVVMNQTLLSLARQFEGKQGYLFGNGFELCNAYKCSENYAYNRHAAILKETGLDGLGYTLYSWKHTGAVRAFQSGLDIKKLQTLLRHSSLQITDIYLRSLNVIADVESLQGW